MSIFTSRLQTIDPEIYQAIEQEAQRQEDHIELIASENYASPAVLAAQGSVLMFLAITWIYALLVNHWEQQTQR